RNSSGNNSQYMQYDYGKTCDGQSNLNAPNQSTNTNAEIHHQNTNIASKTRTPDKVNANHPVRVLPVLHSIRDLPISYSRGRRGRGRGRANKYIPTIANKVNEPFDPSSENLKFNPNLNNDKNDITLEISPEMLTELGFTEATVVGKVQMEGKVVDLMVKPEKCYTSNKSELLDNEKDQPLVAEPKAKSQKYENNTSENSYQPEYSVLDNLLTVSEGKGKEKNCASNMTNNLVKPMTNSNEEMKHDEVYINKHSKSDHKSIDYVKGKSLITKPKLLECPICSLLIKTNEYVNHINCHKLPENDDKSNSLPNLNESSDVLNEENLSLPVRQSEEESNIYLQQAIVNSYSNKNIKMHKKEQTEENKIDNHQDHKKTSNRLDKECLSTSVSQLEWQQATANINKDQESELHEKEENQHHEQEFNLYQHQVLANNHSDQETETQKNEHSEQEPLQHKMNESNEVQDHAETNETGKETEEIRYNNFQTENKNLKIGNNTFEIINTTSGMNDINDMTTFKPVKPNKNVKNNFETENQNLTVEEKTNIDNLQCGMIKRYKTGNKIIVASCNEVFQPSNEDSSTAQVGNLQTHTNMEKNQSKNINISNSKRVRKSYDFDPSYEPKKQKRGRGR
ncbi:unnamed protein product, partial [Meganyctiphanes norvegica]